MEKSIGTEYASLIRRIDALSDWKFEKFFRSLLSKSQYSYAILEDRYNATLTLLADISEERILAALASIEADKEPDTD